MDHERQRGSIGSFAGAPQRFEIVLSGDVASQSDLHSHNHVPVTFDGSCGEGSVGVAQVKQLAPRIVSRQRRLSDH